MRNNVIRLDQFAGSRDNNFNLLRLIAAFMVLYSHCFALSTGLSSDEPLRQEYGVTFGSIAVDIFFVTSGFLVTASLATKQYLWRFVRARALRIYPGLFVAVTITVFVLGPLFTTLPVANYLANQDTILHYLKNTTLVSGVVFTLPGMFESNPLRYAINYPLWSLPYEIGMYGGLAILWLLASLTRTRRMENFRLAVLVTAVIGLIAYIAGHFFWRDSALLRLTAMFAIGASCYLFRNRVVLSKKYFVACIVLVFLSALDKHVFFVCLTLALPYLVFCFAYLPGGLIRRYNQLGDYSYGVYIYAFPVQQAVAHLLPGVGVGMMLILSTAVTALFAVSSWHFIESRALKLK
jgi:peptidoglycan/LPS O-acetylase OafA/YrhL